MFLDGVYADHSDGSTRFRWVKAPTSEELTRLVHTIAQRVGRYLERQGLLERDAENSYPASDAVDEDPMVQLHRCRAADGTQGIYPSDVTRP